MDTIFPSTMPHCLDTSQYALAYHGCANMSLCLPPSFVFGQAGDNPSHHRHRPTLKRTHACVMYVQVYRTDVLYILDWWSDVCPGLVYYMYVGEGRGEALPLHLY